MQHATPATSLDGITAEINQLTTIRDGVVVVGVKRWHMSPESQHELMQAEARIDRAVEDGLIDEDTASAIIDGALEDWWRITIDMVSDAVPSARVWSDGRSSGWCVIHVNHEITEDRLESLIEDRNITTLTAIRDVADIIATNRDGFTAIVLNILDAEIEDRHAARVIESRRAAQLSDAIATVRRCALILGRDADAVRSRCGDQLSAAADTIEDAIGGAR